MDAASGGTAYSIDGRTFAFRERLRPESAQGDMCVDHVARRRASARADLELHPPATPSYAASQAQARPTRWARC